MRHAIHYFLIVALAECSVRIGMSTWFLGSVFIDPIRAAWLDDWGWTRIALSRAVFALLVGLIFAALSAAAIRGMKWLLRLPKCRRDLWIAMLMGAIPALADIAGAVKFAITRPYLVVDGLTSWSIDQQQADSTSGTDAALLKPAGTQ